MTEQAESMAKPTKIQIKHRWTGAVLFECDVPPEHSGMAMRYALEKATTERRNLRGSNLSVSDLSVSDLSDIKADLFDILLRAPREVDGLRDALVSGRVDGSTYEGPCCCLVGTIANVRGGCNYQELGNGISPNSSRSAERWFFGIKKGDTPETNQISQITVEWLDEFVVLLGAAKVA
jgi:hypothetical protein